MYDIDGDHNFGIQLGGIETQRSNVSNDIGPETSQMESNLSDLIKLNWAELRKMKDDPAKVSIFQGFLYIISGAMIEEEKEMEEMYSWLVQLWNDFFEKDKGKKRKISFMLLDQVNDVSVSGDNFTDFDVQPKRRRTIRLEFTPIGK